ncbi:nicotinamide-nucleotide amidohydrolase family protein [Pseudokineococcus basanitobsidens]|uniref:Nicotinamide-nucleotide amidohydrolase family protein n=1 Tax=Pseudokineococcus basanitobsidens TaxID=1926649 RepID=A0ABU8RJ40_9ACTN
MTDARRGGDLARRCVDLALGRGSSLATAESLTAGLVSARLADVPGASAALRGGVVAYAVEVKTHVLGVPGDLLGRHGPVHPDVAVAMADGVRALLRAQVGVATTGVAGPGPADGHPAGTVHVAVTGLGAPRTRALHLPGSRAEVRAAAADAALALLLEVLAPAPESSRAAGTGHPDPGGAGTGALGDGAATGGRPDGAAP